MVEKIISGGQTGVDRAALDVAFKLEIPCGGWCPKGRLAEDGPIPEKYPLKESVTNQYPERTLLNVKESDGTLILFWEKITGGTALTEKFAQKLKRPFFLYDVEDQPEREEFVNWIKENKVQTINVAGPRGSHNSRIYPQSFQILFSLFS